MLGERQQDVHGAAADAQTSPGMRKGPPSDGQFEISETQEGEIGHGGGAKLLGLRRLDAVGECTAPGLVAQGRPGAGRRRFTILYEA